VNQNGAPEIAVLGSALRADERKLLDALDRRHVSYTWLDTRELWSVAGGRPGPWPCVINREIGQVRAAYAARVLEADGAVVLNDAAAIETCGDKWRTSLALTACGIPTPRTALGLTPQAALSALDEIGYPALIKPLVGSWGRLIAELRDAAMARDLFEYVAALPGPQSHIVYVQELIAKPGRDIRAIVLGGELLGASYRIAEGTRTNVARGARTEPCEQTSEVAKLAVAAAAAVGAEIAAVDLVEDTSGQLLVLEVNHRVEFAGFQAAMGDRMNVADRIVDLVLTVLARGDDPPAPPAGSGQC
jgi:[lysine-biosynthesis-protein LysW]--L-2-aminoadipate ligase